MFRPAMKRFPVLLVYVSAFLILSAILTISGCGGPAFSTAPEIRSPVLYFFSLLDDQAQDGPRTYVSASGTSLTPFTKRDGANIVPYIAGFRDPRLLHVGGLYYYSYTAHRHRSPTLGLLYSLDLKNWTPVNTPDWSGLGVTRYENAIWNGAWWDDKGTYYLFFGVCQRSAFSICQPYFVHFMPGLNTFGTPHAISFTTPAPYGYNIVMSVFRTVGKNWALLQTRDSHRRSIVALASFASLSAPWTTTWTMIGDQPTDRESGAVIVLPNGIPRVYYVRTGGGQLFYTTASGPDPATAKWSTPKIIPPFRPGYQPVDWVDVVAISDFATLRYMSAL